MFIIKIYIQFKENIDYMLKFLILQVLSLIEYCHGKKFDYMFHFGHSLFNGL